MLNRPNPGLVASSESGLSANRSIVRSPRSLVGPVFVCLLASAGAALTVVACDDDLTGCSNDECFSFDASAVDAIAYDARPLDATARDAASTDPLPTDGGSDASSNLDDGGDAGTIPDDGGPRAFAEGLAYPWRIVIGGQFLYTTISGEVAKFPLTGGAPTTITQNTIQEIAADATNLYFATINGTVYKRAHGGVTNVPISNASVALQVRGLTAFGGSVYWTEFLAGGTLKRVAIDGSTMAGVTASPSLTLPDGVAFANGETYVAESAGTTGSGRILRLNPDGGSPFPLSTNRSGASQPLVDGTRIYWFDRDTGTGPIYSMTLAGADFQTHAITANAASLIVDGTTFYYGNYTGGIVKINVGANTKSTLYTSTQTGKIDGLAVVGNALYWTSTDAQRVMTAPK